MIFKKANIENEQNLIKNRKISKKMNNNLKPIISANTLFASSLMVLTICWVICCV